MSLIPFYLTASCLIIAKVSAYLSSLQLHWNSFRAYVRSPVSGCVYNTANAQLIFTKLN